MQRIQNRCARIITKTRLIEHKTSKSINEEAKLEPINQTLHNRAINIWNNLDITNNQKQKIAVNQEKEKLQFKSSRRICTASYIEPVY